MLNVKARFDILSTMHGIALLFYAEYPWYPTVVMCEQSTRVAAITDHRIQKLAAVGKGVRAAPRKSWPV